VIRFITCLLFAAVATTTLAQQAEIAFRLTEKDLIPEGMAYDPASKSFFVSSIHKNKIVLIDAQKKVSDFITTGQDGIGQVLGMKVANGKLWACSNTGERDPNGKSMVHQYDVATKKLLKKWILQSAGDLHLFNDIVLDEKGNAYISDTEFGAVYKVSNSQEVPELFVKDDELRFANGITITPKDELMVNGVNGFVRIAIATKKSQPLPFPNYYPIGVDGLYLYKLSLVGIQNVVFPVSINQYYLNAELTSIEKGRVIVADDPQWDIPTTGVIVDDWFYFIANSQMRKLDGDKIKDSAKLNDVLIMRVKLN
jgi:Gluconolactonase